MSPLLAWHRSTPSPTPTAISSHKLQVPTVGSRADHLTWPTLPTDPGRRVMVSGALGLASRYVYAYPTYAYSVAYDFRLPGWSRSSLWGGTGGECWVQLRSDSDPSRNVNLQAEPPGLGDRNLLVPRLVEHLDIDPEDAVAAMGIATPYPLLRPRSDTARALADLEAHPTPPANAADRDAATGIDAADAGRRAGWEWLLGLRAQRPGSARPWPGEEPDPRTVDAELDMIVALLQRQDEPRAAWLTGARDALAWALIDLGPLQPAGTETERWLRRRLHRCPDVPAPDVPHPASPRYRQRDPAAPGWGPRVLRARRFRSWLVCNHDQVLGRAEPISWRHQWVAVDHHGDQLSDTIHTTLSDAAFEVLTAAFDTGRTQPEWPT